MIDARHQMVVVTPIYEDAQASGLLFQNLAAEFGPRAFIVAVDDGSIRQPVEVASLEAAGLQGVVLKLRRNVGHQRAIAIGLGYAAEHMRPEQLVVVMDSDGEDLPSSIPIMLSKLTPADVDAVVAQRGRRVETLRFKAFYALYKRIFTLLTGRSINFGNFMALKSHAVRRLVSMQELPTHVAASVLASKIRTKPCTLDRGPRYAGQSKMNFVGLALHGFRALMVFAEDVLVRVGIACAVIAASSVMASVLAIGLKLAGFATPGWFSIALGILFMMFLQTGALALITLMLTGVVRGGTVTKSSDLHDFIDQAVYTQPHPGPA